METTSDLLAAVLVPLIVTAATALGGWIFTKLPGPARDWLQSGTHARDVELVVSAMTRRALALSAGDKTLGPIDVVAYAKSALPETIAKLAPSDDALRTMAIAALQKVKLAAEP